MRRLWGLAALAAAACMVPVAIPGFSSNPYKTQAGYERDAAHANLPVDLMLPDGDPPAATTFKVRAWVDPEYRRRLRWREAVADLVARASRYTEVAFGARLEVEVRPWDRDGDATLSDTLEALVRLDPGADVDWVVGFVGAEKALTSDFHRIGVAAQNGKHFVLRDMNDAGEARAVDEYFPNLDASERMELYTARKRHKELIVFLHEWAHTLGHGHEPDSTHVMSPDYSPRVALFSPEGTRQLRLAVAARRSGAPAPTVVATAAAPAPTERWEDAVQAAFAAGALSKADALLAARPDDPRVPAARAEVLRLRRETGLPPDPARSGVAPDDEPAVRSAFVAIIGALGRDLAAARRLQAAAARRFPDTLPVVLASCSVEGWARRLPQARKSCQAALARWDELPFAHFWAGQAATRPADAIAHHRRVLELDPTQEGSWTALRYLYEKNRDAAALAALRQRFMTRFGREL